MYLESFRNQRIYFVQGRIRDAHFVAEPDLEHCSPVV